MYFIAVDFFIINMTFFSFLKSDGNVKEKVKNSSSFGDNVVE